MSKKIGIALSSGSARGWAHIGALEALQEAQIPIHYIAGSSIGAYVGAVFAGGGLLSLKQFALTMDWRKLLSYIDVVFPKSGFLDGKRVAELFTMHTDAKTFGDLSIPLKIIATDLYSGERVILGSGNLVEAIRASISVPGVLTPYFHSGRWLVDGGLVDPTPVQVVREMGAEIVIAVDLNSGLVSRFRHKSESTTFLEASQRVESERREVVAKLVEQYGKAEQKIRKKIRQWFSRTNTRPHIIDVIGSSVGIMQEQISAVHLKIHSPDILIQPQLGDLKMFDFDQADRSIQEGYRRTKEKIKKIQMLL
ncbi:MAG: patatin-like phospholipase family protein [Fidelibacterota bacterium]